MKPMDFQEATANRILQIYQSGKQNRVLLADEVGLGKTIIASAVVRKVSKWQKNVKKKDGSNEPFKVIYICSNINIANQNYRKLGISEEDCVKFSESRLSMQHLKTYEKSTNQSGEELIPMTPATSFSMTGGQGIQQERALIYAVLSKHHYFSHHKASLKRLLKYQENLAYWDYYVNGFVRRVKECNKNNPSYLPDMLTAVDAHFEEDEKFYKELIEICNKRNPQKEENRVRQELINKLRKLFAEISLEMLKPDLVIMDEFQRFKDLIESDEKAISEQRMLTGKFLQDNQTKVLLLSATPYKPYSTLEELASGEEGHYKEFERVMDFLLADVSKKANFHKVWSDYSTHLAELATDDYTILLAKKNTAENEMYRCICRTERRNDSIFDSSKSAQMYQISTEDITSYLDLQKLMEELGLRKFPIDYVKSAPYLLSFMNYQVQREIGKKLGDDRNIPAITNSKTMLLRRKQMNDYEKIACNNARLQNLFSEVFGHGKNGAELLLWIPASKVYYRTDNVFSRNAGYSKTLVFSCWEMVPRVIAAMTSYEAERLTINRLPTNGKKKYFPKERTDDKKSRRTVTYRLINEMEKVLTYPCRALAELYHPNEHMNVTLSSLRRTIKRKVHKLVTSIGKNLGLKVIKKSAEQVIALLYAFDGKAYKKTLKGIPADVEDLLVNLAIAGPAICAYRILQNETDAELLSEKIGSNFISLFNKQESIAVIDMIYPNKQPYYENVAVYCAEGNLQAVLDEYAFTLGGAGKGLQMDMSDGFMDTTSIQIETRESFLKPDDKKNQSRIRTHFAVGYFNAQVNEKTVQRTENIRKAFNSPFRPFVLATTSIGQEGLDFHMYARKIMHWNLPANPIDLEQREGRINRYMCHAIRQNLAESEFGNGPFADNIWKSIIKNAREGLKGSHSDLIPYWCLPNDFPFTRKIERIVPMYPYSMDVAKYERLIEILSIYRLTLGQPKQEELFEAISKECWDEEKLNELYMNLSPWEHR